MRKMWLIILTVALVLALLCACSASGSTGDTCGIDNTGGSGSTGDTDGTDIPGGAVDIPPLEEGQCWFDAIVSEVNGSSVVVECTACPNGAMNAGALVSFAPARAQSPDSLTELHTGQRIRVIYDGSVMETYPLKLGTVYGVYALDGSAQDA